MLLLNNWKTILCGALLIIYSLGLWHISGTYATATLVKAELERTQKNEQLSKDIQKKLEESQAAYELQARQVTKDIVNELLKDPIYKSCRITDSVRKSIQRKLDSQPD